MNHNYGGRTSRVNEDIKTMFGNMIRSQREWLGRSQLQIAKYVGVSNKSVSSYENGETFPQSDKVFLTLISRLEFPAEYIYRLYDEGGSAVRKALLDEPKTREMLELRSQGLTNKKIAETMGTKVSEVYERIGKKSDSVMIAEQNNKTQPLPSPEPEIPETAVVNTNAKEVVLARQPATDTSSVTLLKERRVVKIIDLEGQLCNYQINQQTGTIELVDYDDRVSMVRGFLDKDSIEVFIAELNELKELI